MSRTKCPSCETRYNRPSTTIGDRCMVCKGGIIVRDNDELSLRLAELSQLSLKMEDILSDIRDFDPDYVTEDLKGDVEAVTAKIQDCLDTIGLTQAENSGELACPNCGWELPKSLICSRCGDESSADKHWTYVLGSRTEKDDNGARMFWKNDLRDPGWASFEALDDGDICESMSENSEDGIWMTLAVAQEEFNRDTTRHKKDCMCGKCDPKADKLYAALTDPDKHDGDCRCDNCDPMYNNWPENQKKTDDPDQELSSESHL